MAGRGPTWDAVARVTSPSGQIGAIFAEAKGRIPEMRTASGCKATNPSSIQKITRALHDVQNELEIAPDPRWLGPVYQLANRLAWLWFARCHPAHRADPLPVWLLSIYFTGVTYHGAKPVVGPASEEQWRPAIDDMHAEMGLPPGSHALSDHWLEIFLPSIVVAI